MQIQPITISNNTKFEGWKINGNKIINANYSELRNLSEHFHRLKKEELIEITTILDFTGAKEIRRSEEALMKLQNGIRDVLSSLWNWNTKISELEDLKANGKELSDSQRENLKNYKSWVSDVEKKAANCRNEYYAEDTPSTNDYNPLQDDLDIVTFTNSHYD